VWKRWIKLVWVEVDELLSFSLSRARYPLLKKGQLTTTTNTTTYDDGRETNRRSPQVKSRKRTVLH
jgi:hypothetical protein